MPNGGSTLCRSLDNVVHHFLEHRASSAPSAVKVRGDTLLDVFPDHVHLDIDIVSLVLAPHDDFLLGVSDEHNLPPRLCIIHSSHGQRGTIEGDIAFLDNVPQYAPVARLQAVCHGIAVWSLVGNDGDGINMALDEMTAHPRGGADSSLQIDGTAFAQLGQIRAPQSLGGDADFEVVGREVGDGQACAVDADAVAQVAVVEDLGAVADGQRSSASARTRLIVLDELRDGCGGRVSGHGLVGPERYHTYCQSSPLSP